MKNDISYVLFNQDTRVMVFNHGDVLSSFGRVPKKIIESIAADLELYLYGETCMHTGKHLYKVGKVTNENGGVVNFFTTTSKAKFNRFVCEFINTK